MRGMLAAAVLGLALFGGARAEAATVEEIAALVHDVCMERGADRDAVETIAQERAWRALSRAELDAIPMRGIRPGSSRAGPPPKKARSISGPCFPSPSRP